MQKLSWSTLGPSPDLAAVQNFLTEFAKGVCVREAKRRRAYFESDAWEDASESNTIEAYNVFVNAWPKSRRASDAKRRIAQIEKAQREAELFRVAKEIGGDTSRSTIDWRLKDIASLGLADKLIGIALIIACICFFAALIYLYWGWQFVWRAFLR